jgi:FKBP-type peptidyl-prolyl cis-trans isomerase (trigger factor)
MSVVEAMDTFTKISEGLFSDPKMKPAERNVKLRLHIEKLMEEHSIPVGATLVDTNQYSNECKL